MTTEQRSALMESTLLEGLGEQLNPERYNGASFVGLQGVVVKSHGGTGTVGFSMALDEAIATVESGLVDQLATSFGG